MPVADFTLEDMKKQRVKGSRTSCTTCCWPSASARSRSAPDCASARRCIR